MTSVLFSGSYIAGKYTTLDLGPLTTTLLRYVVALLFLSGLLLHYKRSALVAGMAGGSRVDGRAALACDVLCHVGNDPQRTKVGHETLRVIGLVRPKGESRTRDAGQHLDSRLTLAPASSLGHYRVDHQTVTVIHQYMPGVTKLRRVSVALAVHPCLRISGRFVGVVLTRLTTEVTPRVAPRSVGVIVVRPVLTSKAALRRPGLNQRPIDAEVLIGNQPLRLRLGHHMGEELARDIPLEQPVTVLREGRTLPYRIIGRKPYEPPIQQVVIELLVLRRRDIVPALLLGLFGIVGYHYFFFLSLRYTEVANTAIINALSPVLTGVAAALLIKERLSRRNYAGLALAFLGVLVLLSNGSIETILAVRFNKGDLLMLLSVISWVVYALLIKSMLDRYSGFTLTFYATLFGVLMLLFLAPQEAPLGEIQSISRTSLLSILYMGIFGSGLGYLLYNLSIREIGATRTSSFVYSVIPLVVAVLALLFFQQSITPEMIASMALILIGLHMMLAVKPREAHR